MSADLVTATVFLDTPGALTKSFVILAAQRFVLARSEPRSC